MTRFLTTITLAAAGMLVAGMAQAQSLKAEIPFAFDANGWSMQPGTYRVTPSRTGSPVIAFEELNSRKTNLVQTISRTQGPVDGADGEARLVFRCTAGTCDLQQIWTAAPGEHYAVPVPSRGKALGEIRIVAVRLR